MKMKVTTLALIMSSYAWVAAAQSPLTRPESQGRHEPPPQAYEDCRGRKAGDVVQHTTPEGKVAATCVDSPRGLTARPNHPPKDGRSATQPSAPPDSRGTQSRDRPEGHSIEQALSDRAQLHTIAFDGLAFLTGDFGLDTFLPPGRYQTTSAFNICGITTRMRQATAPPS